MADAPNESPEAIRSGQSLACSCVASTLAIKRLVSTWIIVFPGHAFLRELRLLPAVYGSRGSTDSPFQGDGLDEREASPRLGVGSFSRNQRPPPLDSFPLPPGHAVRFRIWRLPSVSPSARAV